MSPNPNVDAFAHHPKYYLEGADLHIIVGDVLFRVHSYFFTRESKTFHNKVYPAGPGVTREGTSDRDPIRLSNVSSDEFETFLFVFYNPRYSVYENTVDQWKVILKFAQEWNFNEVKELAVRELHKKEELSIVDRLALYQDFKVDPRHLIPLYSLFCERDTSLTISESKILGLETTVLIASMREKLRARPSDDGRSPLPNSIEKDDIYRNLEKEIGVEVGSTEKFQKELGFPPVQVLSTISSDADPKLKLQNGTRGEGGKTTSGQTRGRGRGQ